MKFWNAPSKVCTDTFQHNSRITNAQLSISHQTPQPPKIMYIDHCTYQPWCLLIVVFVNNLSESVCVWERERENFDITSYPEIISISCQDFGYFVPRLDCNFVQDFTLTSYLDSTQYWQFTYTDFFPHYLQPWRTSYTKFNFVTSYQNRYPLL